MTVDMAPSRMSFCLVFLLILYLQTPVLALGNSDIEITSFETAPSAIPGEDLYVEYTLINNGNYTSGPLQLTYYLSTDSILSSKDIIVSQYTIRSVKPEEIATGHAIELIPSTVPLGVYYPIIEVVSTQSAIKDLNPENNVLTAPLIEITAYLSFSPEWVCEKASELLFLRTNEERERRNVPPLLYNKLLESVAQGHADDMAKRDYFDHVTPEGKSPHDRAVDQGYPYERPLADGTVIHGIGENIVRFPTGDSVNVQGFGYIDPTNPIQLADVAISSFLNSASHKKTLLDDIYHEIGVATAMADDGYYYLAQNFG